MAPSTVEAVTDIPARARSAGLRIAQLHADVLGASLDPFLMCDCFWMAQPFFPPHPHAGFSAVTYMLPESEGGFVNRDSLGNHQLIRPGALHWTEAARGVMHEEVPIERGVTCQGLQIFVDLPAALKLAQPMTYHMEPQEAQVLRLGSASVRVMVGELKGVVGLVQPRTECGLWDVTLDPDADLDLPLAAGWQAFGILTKGQISGFAAPGSPVAAVSLRAGSDRVSLRAGAEGARLVIFAGRPLAQELAFGGPFVMSNEVQLLDAKRRYAAGQMGRLEASF